MIYEFGAIRVDKDARQIQRGESAVHLPRKAFELLLALLEHRPDVMSKAEIHGRLWPDSFVSESSIQTLVSELRRALGDDERGQSWLRTVHGVGYAFGGEAVERGRSATLVTRAWLVAGSWRVPLVEGDNVVGRGGGDVVEIDRTTVSRRHARISVGQANWVEDLGCKNGTWVRDERVTDRAALADGDSLRLGSLLFTFRLSRGADSTDTKSGARASGTR